MIEEKEREEGENAYRTLADNIPGIVYRVFIRENNRMRFFNDVLESLTGYTPDELKVGEVCTIDPLIVASDRENVIRTVKAAITNRRPFEVEYRLKHKDGSTRYCMEHGRPIPGPDGDISYIDGVIFDITERKHSEEALREYEARYRGTLDIMLEGCQIIGFDWRYLYVNDAVVRQGRRTKVELLNHTMMEAYPGIEDTEMFAVLKECMKMRVPRRMENEFAFPDGTKGWFDLSMQPVPEGVFILSIETTERRRAEDALRESEERYRLLFERSPIGIGLASTDGKVISANQTMQAITGYSADELKRISLAETYENPADRKRLLESLERNGSVADFPVRLKRKDGTLYDALLNVSRIRIAGKDLVQTTCVDVTERKRAEEALANERNVLRTLIDNLPDNIFIKDAESRFMISNLPHARLLRAKTPDDIVGKTDFDIFPRELAASYYDDEQAVIRSGQPLLNREERTIDPEGKTRWLLTTKVPLRDDHGKVIGIAGINRDITERKAAEEELRKLSQFRESIIDNANVWLDVLDEKANVVIWNRAAEVISGYSREEVVGHEKIWEWLYPDEEYRKSITDTVAEVVRSGRVDEDFETRIRRKDGQTRIISWNERNLLDRHGKAIGSIALGRDVTQHKKMEEELQKLASVVRHSSELVNLATVDGKMVFLNEAGAKMLGIDPAKVEQVNITQIIPDQLQKKVGTELLPALMSGGTWEGDLQYRNLKTGQLTDVHATTFTIKDPTTGKPLYLANVSLDITERKRMEEELRRYLLNLERLVLERTRKLAESEKRFRELADLLPQIVFEVDKRDNFTFLNHVGFTSTGYSKEDLQAGLNALQLYSPGDRERRDENVKRLIAGETVSSNEYLLQRKDGSTFPAIVHSAPIVHENEIVGLRGIAIDITERKQMEEELRSARARLEHVISDNPAVIYTGRPRPDFSDFDATYMSRSAVSLLGLEPEDLIGHPEIWYDRVHPDDLTRYYAELPLLWREGQHTFEYRFLHKDGAYRWIREEARVIRDAAGKPVEVLGYWSDITRERQIEEMRDRFMSAVTHELRTPLVSIKGYLDLVLTGESGPVSTEVKSNLEVAKRNTDRLTSLTDDLLDIQRLQSGKLQVNLERIDLREIIAHATSEIKPFIKAKKQRFKVAVPKKPLPILGDPVRLSQVLMNLLGNASKFTPEGGEIRLMVKDAKEMIVVKVTDTGIGIRKEDLSRVFEPFAAIKKPSHIKGTGLGLSVTKGLVEAHTGKIWVESPGQGKGSTFVFALLKRVVK